MWTGPHRRMTSKKKKGAITYGSLMENAGRTQNATSRRFRSSYQGPSDWQFVRASRTRQSPSGVSFANILLILRFASLTWAGVETTVQRFQDLLVAQHSQIV